MKNNEKQTVLCMKLVTVNAKNAVEAQIAVRKDMVNNYGMFIAEEFFYLPIMVNYKSMVPYSDTDKRRYIGRCDSYGVKIHEGDFIVTRRTAEACAKQPPVIYLVEWNTDTCGFVLSQGCMYRHMNDFCEDITFEVVGNIKNHPEIEKFVRKYESSEEFSLELENHFLKDRKSAISLMNGKISQYLWENTATNDVTEEKLQKFIHNIVKTHPKITEFLSEDEVEEYYEEAKAFIKEER